MPVLPLLSPSDLSSEDRPLLAHPLNFLRVLANSPGCLRAHNSYGTWIAVTSNVEPRLREFAILFIALLADSRYSFVHHYGPAIHAGVTDADIEQLRAAARKEPIACGKVESSVLGVARAMWELQPLHRDDISTLREEVGDRDFVELVEIIGFYCGAVRTVAALDIAIEDDSETQQQLQRLFPE